MKKQIISIVVILLLVIAFCGSFMLFNDNHTNVIPQFFYDLKDIQHFSDNDIQFKNSQFNITDVKTINGKKVAIKLNCDHNLYKDFEGHYSFYLANHDTLITGTGCNYAGDGIVEIVELQKDYLPDFDQIVIVENNEYKNQIVINICGF